LFGSLDEVLGHRIRYTPQSLRALLEGRGFAVETMFDFNRVSVPGWWLNGSVLRRKAFSRFQLKFLNTMIPMFRRIDRWWPWSGLSVIAVARKR